MHLIHMQLPRPRFGSRPSPPHDGISVSLIHDPGKAHAQITLARVLRGGGGAGLLGCWGCILGVLGMQSRIVLQY